MEVTTKFVFAFILIGLLSTSQCRDIRGDVHFYYDPESHYFVTVTTTRCYIVALTKDEKDRVHSRDAMEDLELSFMREWLGTLPETRMFHDNTHFSANIFNWCVQHAHDIFKLERPVTDNNQAIIG